ncbi:TetR/AcrR family transcriptional regulator [Mesonia sp. K7]|uniref:TetR/AcrR family transcriptional regulator n=1 Tax=Mesonia sp. K7 TaxID=2218606 RepID=UPI000DAA9FF2|nr:TetR/AcrR family transcriptional regulator [Mesonia sp. K7]PZD78429.1 TetR/AcrR family transcriptional regulator [Mesonia sp. K7]
MENKILDTAAEMFLNYGFKSVTMDDIANEIGISKKTIYVHYKNKSILVEKTVEYLFHKISAGIEEIRDQEKNPIEEILEIKRFLLYNLKEEKSSPEYQLEKYYPKVYKDVKQKQYCVMSECVVCNLERGLELGLYRKNINTEFISKIYFNSMMALKNKDLFPLNNFSMQMLMNNYLEYHLRGICTEKGLEILNRHQLTNQ